MDIGQRRVDYCESGGGCQVDDRLLWTLGKERVDTGVDKSWTVKFRLAIPIYYT